MKKCISLFLVIVLCCAMLPSAPILTSAASTGLGEVKISGGQRDLLWPVPGVYKLTSCFLDPDYASTRGRMHYAIDIGAASGKPVVAPYDGTVDAVGYNSSEGYWVRLIHNYKLATGNTMTLYTKYIHLKSYSVEKGQSVKKGAEIAKVGSTGTSSSHLDFQILTNRENKSASNSLDPFANNLLELPANIYYAGTCNCCKSYISTIKELYATPLSYLSQCTAYSTHVTIQTTKSTYIKSLPCSEKTDASSENIELASAGSQYEAIGLYRNSAGNLWYKVSAKNGSVGYMYAGDATFVSEEIGDIVQSGITAPANHTQGKSYILNGTVSSTYSNITKISVYVYDANGNNITGTADTVTGNKYSLKGSTIDDNTRFGSLSVGQHTLKVTVYFDYSYADSATTMTTWSTAKLIYEKKFSVVSASCTHSYTSKITTAATCTTAGVRTYTCSKCSSSYTEVIAATGIHSYSGNWITQTQGTCTIGETQAMYCNYCSAAKTQTLPAPGHSYTSIVTSPTCTSQGYTTHICSRCGDSYTDSYTEAGHSYVTEIVHPTCTTQGYTIHFCNNCTLYYQEDTFTDALGHSWSDWQAVVTPTCNVEGMTQRTCSNCGVTESEKLPIIPHRWGLWVTVTEPTCTNEGKAERICSAGGEVETKVIPSVPHVWSEWEIVEESTCTSEGKAERTCSNCREVQSKLLAALPGKVAQWNISLQSDFRAKFMLEINADIVSTASIRLGIGEKSVTYMVSELSKHETGYYIVYAHVAAAQMDDNITIQICSGGDTGQAFTYTIRQYCDTILADSNYSQYHSLVKEMLNYGAMAQVYFDYNTQNLANAGIAGTAAKAVPGSAKEWKLTDNIEGLDFYGASLVYRDRIAVRYYFTGNVTGCVFVANGSIHTPVAKDGMYYVEIADILPQDLEQQITLTIINPQGSTMSVTYGPMNYIVRMNTVGNTALKNLLKALYNYHLAVKALA